MQALRTAVTAVAFSADERTSALAVRYADDQSEVWDTAQRRTIGVLGLGVGSNVFDGSGQRLVVRYLAGDTYVVDVDLLRALPPDLGELSDPELQVLACQVLGNLGPSLAAETCQ